MAPHRRSDLPLTEACAAREPLMAEVFASADAVQGARAFAEERYPQMARPVAMSPRTPCNHCNDGICYT
jgi:hypothetical protein